MSSAHRWHERRQLRRLERRRRRSWRRRGPTGSRPAAYGPLGAARQRIVTATRGDRPLVVVLAGALVLAVVVLSGPAQSYLDGRGRVEALEAKAAALDEENEQLEQRAADLSDPLNIELLAREQQGFIRPGEVPYTLVPPEVDRPVITTPRDEAATASAAWYERAWDTVRDWFG